MAGLIDLAEEGWFLPSLNMLRRYCPLPKVSRFLITVVPIEMDADKPSQNTSHQRSRSARRVEKQGRGKARAAMVFPVFKKGRRVGPRQKQKK